MGDGQERLLQFPCTFPIKAMGAADGDVGAVLLDILERHAPAGLRGDIATRLSRGGKWLAVTAVIEARSQQQLDAIYRELSAHERIVIAL